MGTGAWNGRRATEIRARFQARIEGGELFVCPFCRRPVMAWQRWDVDHAQPQTFDRADVHTFNVENLRPAHARCNRAAGAKLGNRMRAGRGPLLLIEGVVVGQSRPRPRKARKRAQTPRTGPSCAVCETGAALPGSGLCGACTPVT